MDRTDLSGLGNSTTYYFYVNETEYSITTGTDPTFEDVNDLMHGAINADGYRAIIVGTTPNEDIRVEDRNRKGSDSKVIMSSGSTGLDLFTSLNGFSSLEEPVSGGGKMEFVELIIITSGNISINGTTDIDSFHKTAIVESGSIIVAGINDIDTIEILEATSGGVVTNGDAIYSVA